MLAEAPLADMTAVVWRNEVAVVVFMGEGVNAARAASTANILKPADRGGASCEGAQMAKDTPIGRRNWRPTQR